jgi:hypothetical protein
MSSNQKQEQKDLNLHVGLSIFDTQVVRTIFPDHQQDPSVEELERRESISSNNLSPGIDYHAIRRFSAPSISRGVGSNKYFTFFCYLFLVFYLLII